MTRQSFLIVFAAIALATLGARAARADLVKLKNGGEVRGTITSKISSDPSGQLTVETLTGGIVVVENSEVEFVTRRLLKVEHYETRARQTPQTIEAQWELAEWCRQNNLEKQREEHLRLIIELDPEHKQAHQALGHTQHDGEWLTRDELMQREGYVKHRGRYITPQELEIIEKSQAELEAEREWYRQVRLWHGWLSARKAERRQEGYEELLNITDPDAVPALTRYLHDDKNQQVRALFVEILSRIPGPKPVSPLVEQSLKDADNEIRYAALNAISPEQYELAASLYVKELKHEWNTIVRRAGMALERVGNEQAVPALIDALVTTHRYRVRVPVNPDFSFSTDGSMGPAANNLALPPDLVAMLRTGQLPHGVIINNRTPQVQTKVVAVKHDHRNKEVLAALRKLTNHDHGYDRRTWRLWWLAEKSGNQSFPATIHQ